MAEGIIQYQELLNVVRSMERVDELFYFFLRACENGNLQICQICLDAGADINICEDFYKQTLLNMLVERDTFTTEVGDWLIEKGANINLTGLGGFTNLTLACCNGKFDIAKYFIDKGIKIKQYKTDEGLSDLFYAVEGKNYEIVKMLLDLGVDLENYIKHESNPFISAVDNKLLEIVELFLQKGASPNFYDYDQTPLHIATANRDIQMVNILLKYNANVNAQLKGVARFVNDGFALTAMDIAVLNQDIEMQKLLFDFGGTVSSKEEKIGALTIETLTKCDNTKEVFLIMKKMLES